jgi:uncharacterized protein YqjF (DUF2071 family)
MQRESVVMRPIWHHLLFLHWAMPAEILQPLLPPQLEIDTFDGIAYVGLVPFTMRNVRPNWLPAPLAHLSENFHETNVRTYVRFRGEDPGVWFWSLDAADLPATIAARLWFKLPYFWSSLQLQLENDTIKYFGQRLWPGPKPAEYGIECRTDSEVFVAQPGTIEHFLVERYRLYSRRGNTLYSGRVQHVPYPLQRAKVLSLRENVVQAAGITRPTTEPLVLYSRGVDVEVFPLQRAAQISEQYWY